MMVNRLVSTVRFISARSGMTVGFGASDQRAGVVELLAMLRQELGGGDEQWASQARIGVRAGLLQRQAAITVG